MFSISFLPWVILLLVVIFSIPVAATIENSRRKKMLAEMAAANPATDEGDVMMEGEAEAADQNDFGGFGGENADPFGNADDPFK